MISVPGQSLRLMRRELRGGLRGFGVFVSCLFLGVFAISAIGNFSAGARAGLLDDASALLGGDLEVRLSHRPVSDEQREFLNTNARVSEVLDLRTMVNAVASDRRTLVELKAVDGSYPLYGEVLLEPQQSLLRSLDGDNLPGAVVDRALLNRLEVALGDQLLIGDRPFRITAVLTNEPDRSFRIFNLGPRVLISTEALKTTGLLQPGSLVNYNYRLKLADPDQVEPLRRQLQDRFPEAGWRLRSWREATPRISDFIDRLETNLSLLGLCALLLGGLGVTGAVRGYLGSKMTHIATMKCLGASRRVIFTTYFLQILLLGGLATLLGLLGGAAVPWLLTSQLGPVLPFPIKADVYPLVWLVTALFGLLTAVLFSLNELGRACRVPAAMLFRGAVETRSKSPGAIINCALALIALLLVALAFVSSPDRQLATWFILGATLCFALFQLLARLVIRLTRQLPRPRHPALRLALTSLKNPGSPAGNIIFSLGLGLTILVMIVQIQGNLNRLVTANIPKDAPTFFFFDVQQHQLEPLRRILKENSDTATLAASPTLRGRITAIAGVAVEERAIDPEVRWAVRGDRFLSYASRLPESTRIVAGAWWPEDYQGPPQISLTADLAEGFGVGIGDTLSVNILGRTITATIASLRQVDWSTLELNFALIFSPGVLEQAPHTYLAATQLPPGEEDDMYQRITRAFTNISAVSVRDILDNVATTLSRIGWAFRGMAAMTLLTGFLVLIGAVSADQHRRIRDAVIYKVCGSTRWDILQVFAAEFLLLGVLTGMVSLVAGSLAALAILKGPLNADFDMQLTAVLLTLGAGIALTLLLGLLGTWKALGQKASNYLRR